MSAATDSAVELVRTGPGIDEIFWRVPVDERELLALAAGRPRKTWQASTMPELGDPTEGAKP